MQAVDVKARIQLKHLLLCTDFSDVSAAAFPFAVDLARQFGATLHALYVRNPDDYVMAFPEGGSVPAGYTITEAKNKLNGLLDPLADIRHETMVYEGQVWPCIEAAIEKNQIDLLVVGTKGRTGASKLLLGSKAEEIFRQTACPVWTVGPEVSMHFPQGVGTSVREILWAVDFSPESMAAAPYAVSLAQEYQARLILLHVLPDPKTGDLIQPKELVSASYQRLRSLVPPEAGLWCEPRFEVEQGPTAETILDIARLKNADLIVLGVRPARFVAMAQYLAGAIAYKVVVGAHCPVLTVRG